MLHLLQELLQVLRIIYGASYNFLVRLLHFSNISYPRFFKSATQISTLIMQTSSHGSLCL